MGLKNESIKKKNYKFNKVSSIILFVLVIVFVAATLLASMMQKKKTSFAILSIVFSFITFAGLITFIVFDIRNDLHIRNNKSVLPGKTRNLLLIGLAVLVVITLVFHEFSYIKQVRDVGGVDYPSIFNIVAIYPLVLAIPCFILMLVNYPRAISEYKIDNTEKEIVKERKVKEARESIAQSFAELKKHPGQLVLLIASCLVVLSIFTFFMHYLGGEALETGGEFAGNVFQFALSYRAKADLKAYTSGTLLFVFIFLVILIIANIALLIVRKKIHIKWTLLLDVILGICSLVIAIIMLNSLNSELSYFSVKLGVGPILFSVCHFLAFGLFAAGIAIECYSNKSMREIFAKLKANNGSNSTTKTKTTENKEDNNIKLLKEYKSLYDSGVITKKEFEDKKKKLLK